MKPDTKTLKEYAKESCKKPIWKSIDTLLLTKENVALLLEFYFELEFKKEL